ncbi:hypothetical protein BEWA_023300 [Theileria equi strain WA]|uniref:Uncharacterized protein n=1 Tax=Theileria equi strain WA TaxID=1537102 RepID=L0AWT9_THEEQ|nr:hypothetical protein BEWA_023300 [Theileria equi strain WA]AFZ79481.1 hypothetical protein BEWA_023300 [Theileria equi strain WA]|eukprot:XP_004829147.1 hypothetical protein BEWA_023300 [Theileria equi strain WA]
MSRLTKCIVKSTVLAKLVKLRLSQHILHDGVDNSKRSLEVAVRAASLLSRIVPVLKIAQSLANKPVLSSTGTSVNSKLGTTRFHNREENVWRLLKPGFEKETKHLKWRK